MVDKDVMIRRGFSAMKQEMRDVTCLSIFARCIISMTDKCISVTKRYHHLTSRSHSCPLCILHILDLIRRLAMLSMHFKPQ